MKQIAILILGLSLLACNGGVQEPGVQFDKTLTHSNGLIVERPVRFDEKVTEDGFELMQCCYLRSALAISVKRSETPPEKKGLDRKRLGKSVVYYRVETDEGGSGGPDFTLWAIKPSGKSWIVMKAAKQEQVIFFSDEFVFRTAWKLFEQARLEKD